MYSKPILNRQGQYLIAGQVIRWLLYEFEYPDTGLDADLAAYDDFKRVCRSWQIASS